MLVANGVDELALVERRHGVLGDAHVRAREARLDARRAVRVRVARRRERHAEAHERVPVVERLVHLAAAGEPAVEHLDGLEVERALGQRAAIVPVAGAPIVEVSRELQARVVDRDER